MASGGAGADEGQAIMLPSSCPTQKGWGDQPFCVINRDSPRLRRGKGSGGKRMR